MLRRLIPLVVLSVAPASHLGAHERWSNGAPVPEWVRGACCGPSDVHHIDPAQVEITGDGYRVGGILRLIPFSKTLPSQDGEYWIFYRDYPDGTQYVFCFFAPGNGA